MNGLMMDQPLLVSSLLTHAERHHGQQEIVSRRVEGDLHRYTFSDLATRSRQLAQALEALGVQPGTRIATLAWNGYRHLELYYAVSGSGAVLHTLNPRLHPDQLEWIVADAADTVLFFDLTFLPVIEELAPRLTSVQHFVLMSDRDHLPRDPGALLAYEDLLNAQDGTYDWPVFDEATASSLCYTSGTTGNPKGVLYSHRSTVLHSFAVALPDSVGLSARDSVLPIVPMFHVNAWGLPYAACMVGAKVVFPGPDLDGGALYDLQETEQVTVSASVPTVWQGQLQFVERRNLRFTTLRRAVIGGAACPPAMLRELEETHGVTVVHGWGMTETSPFGTASVLKNTHLQAAPEERYAVQGKQGRCVFGMDLKIVDDTGHELAWDGVSAGHLMARGLWVMSQYFGQAGKDPLVDGWFPTGDIATIDPDVHADHRPQQGRHQVGRRMDQFHRDREHRDGPPGHHHGGLHRRTASQVGRASPTGRSTETWLRPLRRGTTRPFRRQDGQMVDPRQRRLRRFDSHGSDRQDAQGSTAGTFPGLPDRRGRGFGTTPRLPVTTLLETGAAIWR